MKRRTFLSGVIALCTYLSAGFQIVRASKAFSRNKVVWGGTGFNVPYDEIDLKLSRINSSLNSQDQQGWAVWKSKLLSALLSNFSGQVSGVGDLLAFESDPGLIFSLGFDYENFLRIDIAPGEVRSDLLVSADKNPSLAELSDGSHDFVFYYLFSSVRVYSVKLPRDGRGMITLAYSQPIRAFNRGLLSNSELQETNFVIESLMDDGADFSILSKFEKAARTLSVAKAIFEPKHLRVTSSIISIEASEVFHTLDLQDVFNPNFFAAVVGLSINRVFGSSVLPFVMTDYLGTTLSRRFNKNPGISKIFASMDDANAATYSIELRVTKVLRKISAENASIQQIARGLAMEIGFYDKGVKKPMFLTKLVKVEKREQTKGDREESWYRSNDSIYFYYLIDDMVNDFFKGIDSGDSSLLASAGVRPQDVTRDQINGLKNVLLECRYGT